ncbi:MAG: MFS transporter permease [Betaproteobacteria bacterium RBG_16_56_24]|nr:MAG: MFS transporter permease [Betaproteobacteria bacterium RBG_16_56_24]
MPQLATQQLDSIHSMLSAGHRNLRFERHSLVLWGTSCGGLVLASNRILTAEQFPLLEQRAIAWLILLALTVSGVSLLDWRLTRRAKQARDEAWSFIHRQVLKVWWLLMSVGVLLTFATFFYGGGYMIFAAWVVLTGLGLYVHGLFSEELLEWTGALIISIGIGMLAFRLNYTASQWVAASTLGLGLPLLAAMLDRGQQRAAWVRLVQSVGWLLFVLIPPLLAQRLANASVPPDAPVVSLEEFRRQPAAQQIVVLPAGSTIPVKIEVSGDVFRASNTSVLSLVLNEPVEVAMNNGQLTGDWRFPGKDWALAREIHWISIPWIKAELTPQTGPEIRTSLVVKTLHQPTN